MRQPLSTSTVVAIAVTLALAANGSPADAALLISDNPGACAVDTFTGANHGRFRSRVRTCVLTGDHDLQGDPVVFITPDVTLDLDGHTLSSSFVVLMFLPDVQLRNGHFVNAGGGVALFGPGVVVDSVDFVAAPPGTTFEALGPAVQVQGASNVLVRGASFSGFEQAIVLGGTNVTIQASSFVDQQTGIEIRASSQVLIRDTTIVLGDRLPSTRPPSTTLLINGIGDFAPSTDVEIRNVTVDRTGATGYASAPCLGMGFGGGVDGITVNELTCLMPPTDFAESLYIATASNVDVRDSYFDHGLGVAVDFFAGGLIVLKDNTFDHSASRVGVSVDPTDATIVIKDNLFRHDALSAPGWWGVYVYNWLNPVDITIQDNVFEGFLLDTCLAAFFLDTCGL